MQPEFNFFTNIFQDLKFFVKFLFSKTIAQVQHGPWHQIQNDRRGEQKNTAFWMVQTFYSLLSAIQRSITLTKVIASPTTSSYSTVKYF